MGTVEVSGSASAIEPEQHEPADPGKPWQWAQPEAWKRPPDEQHQREGQRWRSAPLTPRA
jgi:hypothetical protein